MSDAERDAVAEFLQAHYTAGRLTHDELGARVELAYRSRWRSQLLSLTRDLPPVERPAAPARRLRPRFVLTATLVLTLVAVAALLSELPDELQLLFVVLVIPMLVALSVIIVPFPAPGGHPLDGRPPHRRDPRARAAAARGGRVAQRPRATPLTSSPATSTNSPVDPACRASRSGRYASLA